MKHIKKFEGYTNKYNINDLVDFCKDILLELEDDGLYIRSKKTADGEGIFLQIRTLTELNFKWDEVVDYIERIIKFLQMESDFIMTTCYISHNANGLHRRKDFDGRSNVDTCSDLVRNYMNNITGKNYLSEIGLYFRSSSISWKRN